MAILVSGRNHSENWLLPKDSTSFYHLKAYVSLLLDKLNFDIIEKPLQDSRFSDAIEFSVEGKTIARLGKVSPQMLKKFDIDQAAFYAEIEIEECQNLRKTENLRFKDIPKFNKTRRDLALLVDKSVLYTQLYNAAKNNDSPFLKSINLFDVYEGKNLPENKKSYALSFELLNEEKTMEEKEIAQVMDSLVNVFKKQFNAELRS